MTVPSSFALFPRDEDYACAYLQEAARHLSDARILHNSARFPAAITSAMKAVELALKSVLILYGARGWLDLTHHEVVTKIIYPKNVLDVFKDKLNSHDPMLLRNIASMEDFVPIKQTVDKLSLNEAQNTEYPFFVFDPVAANSHTLFTPELYFTAANSLENFDTARKLLTALPTLFPEMGAWQVVICPPL